MTSGAAALILQKYPTMTPDALKNFMKRNANRPCGDCGWSSTAAGNGELPVGTFGLADPQLPTARLLVELARRGVRAARFTGTAQGGASRSRAVV